MDTWGTAGASAREAYRSASSRRRRVALIRFALILASSAAAWVAFEVAHGRSRLIVLGILAAGLLAAFLWRPDRDTERWLRGAEGELGTAWMLQALPRKGWHVFHDLAVPGSRANIDHLAVGRTGVWVIDTKTTRSPVRAGFASVHLGNRRLSTESVRWQAEVVSDRLGVRARPLVALHCAGPPEGRRFPRRGVRRGGVRVVLASDAASRLKSGRRKLDRSTADSLAGEVPLVFRPAAGRARQNEPRR